MFTLIKDDGKTRETIGSYETIEQAIKDRVNLVYNWLRPLYDEDKIDQFCMHDYIDAASRQRELNLFIDEDGGRSYIIVDESPKKILTPEEKIAILLKKVTKYEEMIDSFKSDWIFKAQYGKEYEELKEETI